MNLLTPVSTLRIGQVYILRAFTGFSANTQFHERIPVEKISIFGTYLTRYGFSKMTVQDKFKLSVFTFKANKFISETSSIQNVIVEKGMLR